jgi:DNA (cytosine-5)-methyltransferase 1
LDIEPAQATTRPTEEAPEQCSLDPVKGAIFRQVLRRDGSVVSTEMGPLEPAAGSQTAREQADRAFLKAARLPPAGPSDHVIRVADLFSGCGAMSFGIREACRALGLGFEAAAAFDLDQAALSVYAANFGLERANPTDLATILTRYVHRRPTKSERALKRRVGRVDLCVAGPPCQGHSDLNNETRRDDPRNELYLRVARFAKLFTPRWIIIENVVAVRRDKGDVVRRTREALERLGYEVTDGLVDAWKLGVPQTRRRHILLACRRKGRDKVLTPLPAVADIVKRYEVAPRSAVWAIQDLVQLETRHDVFDAASKPQPETTRRIDWLFEHERYELPDSERPDCHRLKVHTYGSVYGRMYPDRPAPTITGGFDTMGRGRFVHPSERRTITPHEAARLQFIPDSFDFSAAYARRSRLAQIIGNAVPPKLSYVFALELLR